MNRWLCPACGRGFGRANQSHMCAPAISVDSYFADRPPVQRAICDAVVGHLAELGPIHVEAVGVGILIKRARTFAELRPRRDYLVLSVLLSHLIEHPRILRTMSGRGHRRAHFIALHTVEDVDDDVRAWLTESYFESPTGRVP